MPPKKVKRTTASSDVKGSGSTPTQRKGGGKAPSTRGRGGLKDMLEMPIDVIHEILRHLRPRDLLSLSWSSKSVHAFLMKKSSAYIWKLSLENVEGLPSCPEHLIEPAWASFLFAKHCSACGQGNIADSGIFWECYKRLCKDCFCGRTSDLRYINFDNIPMDMFNQCSINRPRESKTLCLVFEVQKTIHTWRKLVKANNEHELALFIGTEILRVRKIRDHALECSEWAEEQARMHKQERAGIQEDRLQEIMCRLCDLGWRPEIDFIKLNDHEEFYEHKHVRAARKLTERSWQNICEEMVKCMEAVRAKRLALELTKRLNGRWKAMESALSILYDHQEIRNRGLSYGDIALMPEFREIMCSPPDVEVNKESFMALEANIGKHAEQWYMRMQDELRALLIQSADKDSNGETAPDEADVDALELATTIFRCERCAEVMFYSQVMKHRCFRRVPYWQQAGSDAYRKFVSGRLTGYSYAFQRPTVVEGLLTVNNPPDEVVRLIELCGKNTRTVRAKEMDALDVRFVRNDKEIMTWRAAMTFQDYMSYSERKDWRLATAKELDEAKQLEAKRRRDVSRLVCKICKEEYNHRADALTHLEVRHGIKDAGVERESELLEAHLELDISSSKRWAFIMSS
ncbi:uncharacterized protein C8Q71DRAFT_8756 [Rhodofomes roseus]|uniref:F-box domain-containing protein n=1 Tax=Rhodofomes roseus TaxID=34475 RepID=A0ABQ8KWJ5_9APHY|nr:uncharacterized protein C8Q71DRAFT_8756 [Rhodofomes roseus]KAH9843663.1 hypothetical protein C8Q71DRAFT_8756 [Rhodofomes roseus]